MNEFDPHDTIERKDNEFDGIIRPQQLEDFACDKYSGYGYGRYGKYGRYSVYSKYKYAKYAKYGKYSNYGKYGKYSKYGKYGKYAGYGRYGYQRKDGDYRYGYTDEEIDEQNLQKVDEAVDTASSANKDN